MDNDNTTRSLILHGIKLAKELEANLHNLASQPPEAVSASCEEIIRVFTSVRERIGPPSQSNLQPYSLAMIQEAPQLQRPPASAGQALDLFHQVSGGEQAAAGGTGGEVAEPSRGLGGGPSSSQSQRRRREEADRTTVYVLAPQMGNLDMPPEDGYTWRKYGQKDILGSRFPRAYYRCTHQKLYSCPAKKQVQRLDNNPQMLKVTYRYHHTCHMSATAPSAAPPPPQTAGDVLQPPGTTTHPQPQPAAGGGGGGSYWLSMDIRPITSEGVQMQTEFASTSGGAGGSGGAGPSGSGRYGRGEADFGGQAVVDMADAMFNSGSSSNNSMDFIFHTMDEN